MSGFDLSKYQTVKQRKDLFAAEHPSGVILAVPMHVDSEEAQFTVAVWETSEAYVKGLDALQAVLSAGGPISDLQALLVMGPDGLGTAYEAKWMTGASKTSWTENAEESAIGRCLDNIGYHGDGKCSREEIEKVQRAEAAMQKDNAALAGWLDEVEGRLPGKTPAECEKWWTDNKVACKKDLGTALASDVHHAMLAVREAAKEAGDA